MRQSAVEIDHAILDVAADIFAAHGYSHSSVQQIADAVGYSKPGLLHRFGSKDSLHRAVLAEVSETAAEIVGHAVAQGDQPDQLSQVLLLIVRKALDRPGMARMMVGAFRPGCAEPGTDAIRAAGHVLIDALDHPSGPAERLRVVLGLELIVTAAAMQQSRADADLHVDRDELAPLLVSLAAHVMGADDSG